MFPVLRSATHQFLDYHDGGQTTAERLTDGVLLTLVSLNAASVVFDSVKALDSTLFQL